MSEKREKRGGIFPWSRGETQKKAVKKSAPRMSYGRHAASRSLNALRGWLTNAGASGDDIEKYGALLRQRARDLFDGGGLGRSGPLTLATSVVGWGIQPKPKIDGKALGLSDDRREQVEEQIAREFRLWAENHFCDAERQKSFYQLQQLAFLSMLISGDVFCLFQEKDNRRTPYTLTLRLLEADRVSTPNSYSESSIETTEGGGQIVDGVEISREGEVVKYHIASRNPASTTDTRELEWTALDAFGKETGDPNILHVMCAERPEQRRGVPFVAGEIEKLKQLDRYLNSELAANLVSSMFSVFIASKEDDNISSLEEVVEDDQKVTDDEYHYELGSGVVLELPTGKHIETANPMRPNSAFSDYVAAMETVIGASMTIPREVLVKKYENNYTAARAALLDFWRTVKVYRSRFNADFNQPIYEMWLSQAVALGRIDAPGFFDDPLVRQAWCGCLWMGASMSHVDPLKEVNAAVTRINNNISTQEQEAAEYNGNDWAAIVQQRKREARAAKELDAAQTPAGADEGYEDEEDE